METFVPNFTYMEEVELLCAVGHAVAYMKQFADESIDNKDYWLRRAKTFDKLADKLNTETRNFYYNK